MARLAAVLCVAVAGLAAAVGANAEAAAGPAASAVVLQASDLPGAKVVSQKASTPGAGVTQYLRVLRLSAPYGASRFRVVENIAVVVPTETLGAQTYATLAADFSRAKARKQLETGLAAAAFTTAGTAARTTKPAPRIVYSHELHHAVALGDGALEISFTAVRGTQRVDTSVTVFRIGQVIEELIASGTGARTAEADTLSLGRLLLTRAKAALIPVAAAPPTIAGTAQQGQTLTASPGTWTDTPTAYAYQWQRCDAAGANCTDVTGATASTYAVTAADVGTTLRVTVSASNGVGASRPASSSATAVVS